VTPGVIDPKYPPVIVIVGSVSEKFVVADEMNG
jgi:hypothetical protein